MTTTHGIRAMCQEIGEIAAVEVAVQTIKTQLQALQSNPNDPTVLQKLLAAMQTIKSASNLPLLGTSVLSSDLQNAEQLVTSLGNLPVMMPSCSKSNPSPVPLEDSSGHPATLAELMNNPTATYHFTCHLGDGEDSFKASNWATKFNPGGFEGMNQDDGSISTNGGVNVDLGDHACNNSLEVNGSATGAQLISLGLVQLNTTATNGISEFLNNL
jgi:hypothetical protein